jgi:1-acyl-sn-glycerol-3-phosphate acyltransferase
VLARRTGCPVLPVAHNAGDFWPRNGFIKRPGTIQLAIGPIIDSTGRSAADINRMAETWIEAAVDEIRGGHRSGTAIHPALGHNSELVEEHTQSV